MLLAVAAWILPIHFLCSFAESSGWKKVKEGGHLILALIIFWAHVGKHIVGDVSLKGSKNDKSWLVERPQSEATEEFWFASDGDDGGDDDE